MALAALLNQTATLEQPGALDRYGNAAFTSPVTIQCRFEKITKTVINAKGESEPIDGRAYLTAATTVAIGDRFTYKGTHYRVMTLTERVDGRGVVRHYEVMVQVWR